MREEKGGKAASGAPEYPWEDRAMKAAAQFMGQRLPPASSAPHRQDFCEAN